MKNKPYFAVIYMFVMTAVFTAIVVAFSILTRDRILANEQLNFERAVVQAFPEINYTDNQQIHQIFTDQFQKDDRTGAFSYKKEGQFAGYAVPFSGQGFWDEIEGVIGIAADKKTISGVAFYRQKETPGLGARIEEDAFRKQFVGKTMTDGPKPIGIVPSTRTPADNEVHAISGATQTCSRLEIMLNQDIRAWLDTMQDKEMTP